MAVALPALISIGTGAFGAAVGTIAAGTATLGATLGAFATVAGTVLTGIGAITGSKDVLKVGGILSLGAGLANMASGAASGGVSELAKDAAAGSGGELGFMASGSDQIASGATGAFEAAGKSGVLPGLQAGGYGAEAVANAGGNALVDPSVFGGTMPSDALARASGVTGQFGTQAGQGLTLMDKAMSQAGVTDMLTQAAKPTQTWLQAAAQDLNQGDISTYLKKAWTDAKAGLKDVGAFVKDNKELATLGGGVLSNMLGPQAEMADLQRQQMARQQSIMDKARANLNSPVALRFRTPVPTIAKGG